MRLLQLRVYKPRESGASLFRFFVHGIKSLQLVVMKLFSLISRFDVLSAKIVNYFEIAKGFKKIVTNYFT